MSLSRDCLRRATHTPRGLPVARRSTLMMSWLFRAKATLVCDLAVERCRRELAESEIASLKARLQAVETAHGRLLDQVLAREGVITAPLHVRPTNERQPAPPFAAALSALSRDTLSTVTPSEASAMSS